MSEIDFVITWVDGNDPVWLEQYNLYNNKKIENNSNSVARFRDWDNLIFWFRSIEKFCPWVRKIHFVTAGHYPKWLNLHCEKLNLVCHEDIIPDEYLPTFNSRVIGIYLNKIKGLSEQFVYFNDDVFVNDYIKEDYFFKNNLPNDTLLMFPLTQVGNYNHEGVVKLNCMNIINERFDKFELMKNNFLKFFNVKYSAYQNLCNFINSPYRKFSYIKNYHMAQPYLKSIFDEVWVENEESLIKMSANKFRTMSDMNLSLVRYWMLVQGNFNPVNKQKKGKYFNINNDNISNIIHTIEKSCFTEICLNDGEKTDNFILHSTMINEVFLKKFPNKSIFEL